MTRKHELPAAPAVVRCAIYTRKSTEEGLEKEFNSLDAQRESGEAYIKSQLHEDWQCLPDRYDDGGYTGGNTERPALKRLMADIEAGRVNCVVVYKVDRLSRSLMDFLKLLEKFEQNQVLFVSVTQAFNTGTSMGRLVLNILLSFAQFEREMISERTRDKIAAARRKGKWSGGMPVLGYDVIDTKLVVNDLEAERVKQIFALYLEHRSLLAVAKELDCRGWRTKSWTTKKNQTLRGGNLFTKNRLYQLLTNIAYVGKVRYKDETHAGEHQAIADPEVFQCVQVILRKNGQTGGKAVRNKHGALLKGLLHCAHCKCAMSHSFTTKGSRRYRYYLCTSAQQRGWQTCASPSVPASTIEQFVVDEIRAIGRDPALVAATLTQVRTQAEEAIGSLEQERTALVRQLHETEALQRSLTKAPSSKERTGRMAEVLDRLKATECRLGEITDELHRLQHQLLDEIAVTKTLEEFSAMWAALTPREQTRVFELLIRRIDYDGANGKLRITFHPTGIQTLGAETIVKQEHAA
jgi:site-specific DNA recombinase